MQEILQQENGILRAGLLPLGHSWQQECSNTGI